VRSAGHAAPARYCWCVLCLHPAAQGPGRAAVGDEACFEGPSQTLLGKTLYSW